MNIAIFGSGAWGKALSKVLSKSHSVTLYSTTKKNISFFGFEKKKMYDLNEIIALSDVFVMAVPVPNLRGVIKSLKSKIKRTTFISVNKGFEPSTNLLPFEVIQSELGDEIINCVLSGPTFAEDVIKSNPVALTLASNKIDDSIHLSKSLSNNRFRIYSSDDVIGVSVGGAVKNIIAIAAGISDSLDLGPSAKAGLITRGLFEISVLGEKLGARRDTFMGLSGLGDLMLTCNSKLSRNYRVGAALGRGVSIQNALKQVNQVAEGVNSALVVDNLSKKYNLEMPITCAVLLVIKGIDAPEKIFEKLMSRKYKSEK